MGQCAGKQQTAAAASPPGGRVADASHPDRDARVTPALIKQLAADTHFTQNEVEALHELFKRLSNSIIKDGLIHKEEFVLALFKSQRESLFATRVFQLFDHKKNNVIEFGEFVRALSVFHPKAPVLEKATFAFRIYDLGNTGSIDRSEVRTLLLATLREDAVLQQLPDATLERIIDQTFAAASAEGALSAEHSIGPGEWVAFCQRSPSILNNMTLPVLRDLTTAFPSFLLNTTASHGDMVALAEQVQAQNAAAAKAKAGHR